MWVTLYLSGECPIPDLVAAALRLMADGTINPDDLKNAA
jgi:hypothetical protein